VSVVTGAAGVQSAVGVRIAAAPVSWGVSELQALPAGITPDIVLDQMVQAGYAGTELGPPGFLGEGGVIRERLEQRNLQLVGAFAPSRFSRAEHAAEDLAALAGLLDLLDQATPRDSAPEGGASGSVRPKIVLADASVETDRLALTGRIARHPETWLPEPRFRVLVDRLHRAGELCQRRGYDAVLHPHAGSYVETDAEIRAVLDELDGSLVGLCLDTGHVALGGGDPATLARDYADSLRHVHVKDLDRGVLEQVSRDGGDLGELLRRGVFAELGTGEAEVGRVIEVVLDLDYRGWMVVEQDRTLTAADTPAGLLAAQVRNRRFLARYGL
jgi:inosose dehydratase